MEQRTWSWWCDDARVALGFESESGPSERRGVWDARERVDKSRAVDRGIRKGSQSRERDRRWTTGKKVLTEIRLGGRQHKRGEFGLKQLCALVDEIPAEEEVGVDELGQSRESEPLGGDEALR